jgi:hypothetical protein
VDFGQIISFVGSSFAGRALMECAARTKTRFGIRGGLARNLLLERADQYEDLLEAVDPFSDIDLVVDDSRDRVRILEAIFASVPFAGFYRWEVTEREVVTAWLKHNAHFALDESVIWIDGTEVPVVSVSRLSEARGLVLSEPLQDIEPLERFGTAPLGELAVSYVKLLTILARRENANNSASLIESFQGLVRRRAERQEVLSAHTNRRIDLQIAKLFAASVELGRETAELAVLRELPWRERNPSKLLETVASLDKSSEVALGIWRSKGKLRLKIVRTNDQFGRTSLVGFDVPHFTIPSPRSSGCCPHADFSEGPAVVMWRRPAPYETSGDRLMLLAFPQAQSDTDVGSADLYSDEYPLEGVQIPNTISKRRGLIARMDHTFLGALLGRSTLMQVTVAEVEDIA